MPGELKGGEVLGLVLYLRGGGGGGALRPFPSAPEFCVPVILYGGYLAPLKSVHLYVHLSLVERGQEVAWRRGQRARVVIPWPLVRVPPKTR